MLKFKVFITSLFMSLLVISVQAQADVVSLDANYVAGQADVITKLNNDRTALSNGVNNVRGVFSGGVQSSGQIKSGTVGEENCADDMNPRIRSVEGASCQDFVYTGLLPSTTSGTLTGSIPAGTGYPKGYRVVKSSGTAHTFTATRWTWVDMDIAGSFTYIAQNIGTGTPGVSTNSLRIARVSTDASQITNVQDLRVTSCVSGPFSIIADATGEATLGDVLSINGWGNGLNVISRDATSISVGSGTAYINGQYRSLAGTTSIDLSVVGNPLLGTSGLDAGALAASTTYHVFGVADLDGVKPPTILASTSATAPTGATNYRRLGNVATNTASSLVSADAVSISYLGKIRQIVKTEYGDTVASSVAIPADDTVPQNTEGVEVTGLATKITPTSTNNILKIDVVGNLYVGADTGIMALFRDSVPGALAAMLSYDVGSMVKFTHYMKAPDTAEHTFKIRIGSGAATATTLNRYGAGRVFNGLCAASMTITEYEA